jgi:hypothetical protein
VEVDVPDDGIAGRDRVLSGNGHGLLRCARLSPERGFHGWDQSYGGNGFWGCEGEAWVWVQAAWWVSPQYPGWIWVAQQTTFDEVAQADVTEEGYWTPAV